MIDASPFHIYLEFGNGNTCSLILPCMDQGEGVSTRNDAIVPPSNSQCIVLESDCIRPISSSSSNEQHGMIRWLALHSYSSHTHAHIKPISELSEITPIAKAYIENATPYFPIPPAYKLCSDAIACSYTS